MLTTSDAIWLVGGAAILLAFAHYRSPQEQPSIHTALPEVSSEVRTELYKGMCVNNEGFKGTSEIQKAVVIECNDGSKYVDVTGEPNENN